MMITIKEVFRCDSIGHKAFGTYDHDGLKEEGYVTLFWDHENREYTVNQDFWIKNENFNPGLGWTRVCDGSKEFRETLQTVTDLTGVPVTTDKPLVFDRW